jgi:tetratricopeptide (TPR) repeat protein
VKRAVSWSLFLVLAHSFHAEAMDLDTHNMVIEKIRQGLDLNPAPEVRLRLADLYSDRARLKALQEAEKNCQNCEKSHEDRKEALSLYQAIFDRLSQEEQLRSFEQIAQAYTILNQQTQAKSFYDKVIKGKYSHGLKARAYLHKADQDFFAHKYSAAYQNYKKAISMERAQKTPVVGYRMAWCEFNQGQYELAKTHLGQIL